MNIPTNIGERERLLRTILGVYSMLLGFLFIQGGIGFVLGGAGLMALLTGSSGWCPLYTALKKSTVMPDSDHTSEH